MIHSPAPIGSLSLLLGGIAIGCLTSVNYIRSVMRIGSSEVLRLADKFGLLAAPDPMAVTSFRPADFFTIDDYTATAAIEVFGLYCSSSGILVSMLAEYRREDSLEVAPGLLCCATAFVLYDRVFGAAAIVAAAVAVLAIRRLRPANEA